MIWRLSLLSCGKQGKSKASLRANSKTLTDPKLFTKVIVLVALITLARLRETQQYELRSIQILPTPQNMQGTWQKPITFFHLSCFLLSIPQAQDRRGANDPTIPPKLEKTSCLVRLCLNEKELSLIGGFPSIPSHLLQSVYMKSVAPVDQVKLYFA